MDSSTTTNSPANQPSAPEKFMRALARMVAPEKPEEAEVSLMEMVKVLRDVPEAAWSSRSCLEAAATARERGVPTFAQIHKVLRAWKPPAGSQPTEPTPAERAGLHGEDALWLNFWHKRKAEIDGGAWAGHRDAAAALANLSSLVRDQSAAAWRAISGSDGARAEPTEADHEAVRQVTARWLDDQQRRSRDLVPRAHSLRDQLDAIAPPKPEPRGQLTPEQLAAVRANPTGTLPSPKASMEW